MILCEWWMISWGSCRSRKVEGRPWFTDQVGVPKQPQLAAYLGEPTEGAHSFANACVEGAGKGYLEQWWKKLSHDLTLEEPSFLSGPQFTYL